MKLLTIKDIDFKDKKVLVRMDLDVPFEGDRILDDSRVVGCIPTIKFLLEGGAKQIFLLGHVGKYEGPEKTVSTEFLKTKLTELLGLEVVFAPGMPPTQIPESRVVLLDNVRLHESEENKNEGFAQALAQLADVYVNEAFATAHRDHVSISVLPRLMPHAAGLLFGTEVEKLSTILENPKRPLVALISGIKKDKLDYLQNFLNIADKILVGGLLPDYIGDFDPLRTNPKVVIARLIPDKEDITLHSVDAFKVEIEGAGTIIVAGVVGKYEEEGHRQGTKEVFSAVANSNAFKLMGGGDSEAAATLLGVKDKFDWVSTGGGAMLEYLAKGTLPGIEALKS